MAIFTAFLWWTSKEQYGQIKQQTQSMQDQLTEMQSGSAETKIIAEATQTTSEAAKMNAKAAIAGSRAWVLLRGWSYGGVKDAREVFKITFKNYGATPAFDVRIEVEFAFVPGPQNILPKFKHWECPNKIGEIRPGVIAAGDSWNTDLRTHPLNDAQLSSIKNGTARLFAHVCLTYQDVIGKQIRMSEAAGVIPSTVGQKTGVGIYSAYTGVK